MTRYVLIIGVLVGITAMIFTLNYFESSDIKANFLTENDIVLEISKYKEISTKDIKLNNAEIMYLDLDFDDDLDLMISYRTAIDNGIFLIYEYKDNEFVNVFKENWAIEQMNYGYVVTAQLLEQNIYQTKAHVLNLIDGKVNKAWEGLINKFDYANLDNITELHGNFYVDDNGVLHYFYKIDKLDREYKVTGTEYFNEEYVWRNGKFEI